MNNKDFMKSISETFDRCKELVDSKSKYYGQNKDRLGQIKKIASLTGDNELKAIYNLMSKHFVALGEMCDNEQNFTAEEFDAYLFDLIIYSGIIRALIQDE